MNRRRFITCSLGAAGLAGMAGAGWKFGRPAGLKKITLSKPALGTEVHITVFANSRTKGEAAIEAAFDAIDRVESVMSLYRPSSQLNRLNWKGVVANPAPELVEVLHMAAELSRETDGAFDVTVQPLWELYSGNAHPSPTQIAEARAHIDWRKVRIEPNGIVVDGPISITLNGIAQGYAADRARAALIDHGIEHAILDTGEVSSIGEHIERDHWTVGIQHPRQGGLLGIARLDGRSMATSGDYRTNFNEDHNRHHLFDPHTGESANLCASVSVLAPTCMQADACSTACFVMGVERGMQFISDHPDLDALFVAKDGTVTRSEGFPIDLS